MKRSGRLSLWLTLVFCLAGAFRVPLAAAQDAPAKDAEKEKVIREQSIYIPYEKLRKVFEKEGRGVFLPYEKFQELWQAAQEKTKPAAAVKPPVGSLITETVNEAKVGKEVVEVEARVKIELLSEGWNEIPLRLADAAITKATVGDQPARIVSAGEAGYKLLLEKKGKQPEQVELVLHYAKVITRAPGQNSVSFQAPQAPVSRWTVRIAEPGVKVNLHPLIVASEKSEPAPEPKQEPKKETGKGPEKEAAKDSPAKKPDAGQTVVLAFVGAAPTVRIDWTPKAEGATGLEALASVQTEQQLWINEGVIRTRAQLAYTISRAELRQLAIEVPVGPKIVDVTDANVRKWSVETADNKQKISVELYEPAKQTQSVAVTLEEFVAQGQETKVRAAVIRALDVGRQQGVLVVQVAEGLRADVGRTVGLLQIDRGEMPTALSETPWTFSYRFPAVPFELELNLEKVQPRVLVDALVEAELQPDRLAVGLLAVFTVERAGVFRLDLDIPAGFEVRQVRGRAIAGASEAQVDGHYLDGKDSRHLVVNLGRKALGKVGLEVQLDRDLREPDLLAPTGKTVAIPLALPGVGARTKAPVKGADKGAEAKKDHKPAAKPETKPAAKPAEKTGAAEGVATVPPTAVERFAGRVLIYAPESLLVNPAKAEGLRTISFRDATEGIVGAQTVQTRSRETRPVLAYAFSQEPATLVLAVERRKPQVTVRQFLLAEVKEGVVAYRATFFYSVLYSPVKSLRIDVPSELAGQIQIPASKFRKSPIEPPPANLAKGYVAWRLSGETELMGEGQVLFAWEKKLDKLDIGATVALSVPRLMPMEVDRAWGQIALTKTETIDLNDPLESKQLRPIDPQYDLMPGAAAPGAARAFVFHDDQWSLVIPASRYELEQVRHTSIERAVVRMVVTRAGKVSVQALYRLRSAQQRLEVRLPAGAELDAQQRRDGRPLSLERGQKPHEYFIPLAGGNPDASVLIELRYTVEGDGSRLELPEFPPETAVQKVYVCAYLPKEQTLLGKRGPWTDEFHWQFVDGRWQPIQAYPSQPPHTTGDDRQGERQLLDWVCQPLPQPETFQTDGRPYLFSTLDPEPAPDGDLRLIVVNEDLFHVLLIGGVVLAGVLLVPVRAGGRLLALGTLLLVVLLAGVFMPIFSHRVLDAYLAVPLAIVLMLWAGWSLRAGPTWLVPRRPIAPAGTAEPSAVSTPSSESTPPPAASPSTEAPPPPPAPPSPTSEGGPSHA